MCLANNLKERLREFLDNNGGLIVTGECGTRDDKGEWIGRDFQKLLLGSDPAPASFIADTSTSLRLRSGLPGTSAVPPGFQLRLSVKGDSYFIPEVPDNEIAGYWSLDGYYDMLPAEISKETGFIIRNIKDGGRIAWFGANLNGLHGDDRDLEIRSQ